MKRRTILNINIQATAFAKIAEPFIGKLKRKKGGSNEEMKLPTNSRLVDKEEVKANLTKVNLF